MLKLMFEIDFDDTIVYFINVFNSTFKRTYKNMVIVS